MKPLDLSWGNPTFLHPYWEQTHLITNPTNYIYGGINALTFAIKELHAQENNAHVNNSTHIVIANGATQILMALFASLPTDHIVQFFAKSPYFSRLPDIAKLTGATLRHKNKSTIDYNLVTTPSNPTGKIVNVIDQKDLLDLCYNWKTYGDVVYWVAGRVKIFSFAKATGFAGTRIGWALIEDEQLAKNMQHYVELSTGGVSIEAQLTATNAIMSQLGVEETVFDYGKQILEERWNIINNTTFPFRVLNSSGMFMWVTGDLEQLTKLNIIYSAGENHGASSAHARISIGSSDEEFKEFISRFKK